MAPPNATWSGVLAQARASPEVLTDPAVIRSLQTVLATNVSVCTSLGHPFTSQLALIYADMLQARARDRESAPPGGF